jgi:methionyl-tRNA synthetase
VAYPTDWGIEGTRALAGLRIDFAAELGLSYLYGPAHHVRPEATNVTEWAATWRDIDGLWHFNGIDNAFYFAILYPCLFAAAGVAEPQMRGATVNELYLLEGRKFSTSRNHALWADEFLATEDPALVRLFLSWDRPDRYESDFTDVGYRAFCAMIEPLLTGAAPGAGLPEVLVEAELQRAELALELVGFDAALAIRCVVNALSTGRGLDSSALLALAGPALRRPASP